MRFVSEEIFEENSRGAGSVVLGARFEDVIRGAAEHTTAKTNRIRTLKFSKRIDRVLLSIARIVSLYRLLSG